MYETVYKYNEFDKIYGKIQKYTFLYDSLRFITLSFLLT